jgi:hypothetical protein
MPTTACPASHIESASFGCNLSTLSPSSDAAVSALVQYAAETAYAVEASCIRGVRVLFTATALAQVTSVPHDCTTVTSSHTAGARFNVSSSSRSVSPRYAVNRPFVTVTVSTAANSDCPDDELSKRVNLTEYTPSIG